MLNKSAQPSKIGAVTNINMTKCQYQQCKRVLNARVERIKNIAACASPYRCGKRKCDLCLTEKYIIARADQKYLLNKRTEIISKCRHRNKYVLKNIK